MKKKIFSMALMALLICGCGAKAQDVKDPAQDERLKTFLAQDSVTNAKTMALYQEYRGLQQDKSEKAETRKKELEDQMNKLEDQQIGGVKKFIEDNKDNELPAYVLDRYYFVFEYDELKQLCDPSTGYYNSAKMEKPKKQLAAMAKRQPGVKYTDLTMNDMNGKQVKLSQYVGKGYVLVDFWASWCGPCRAEMPNVKKAYETYKGKGFNVVGVSFDSKEADWKKGVKNLGMAWPQMSDLKGWQSAAAQAYGVTGIPSNVLLDAKGVVVAADLRGDDLQNKLTELYK